MLDTQPVPQPGPGEVRIKVAVAGVNFADTVRRGGLPYPVPTPMPFNPGAEFAGEIDACGEGVPHAWRGRRVVGADIRGGAYAQYLCTAAMAVLPAPEGVSFEAAVCLPVQGLTAALALREAGGLRPGDTVFVQGATGGVGSWMLQLAKAWGAGTVVAGVGHADKAATALQWGADVVIDYSQPGWAVRAREANGGRGVDLLLDANAGPLLAAGMTAVATFGRVVVYGSQDRQPDALDPFLIAGNSLQVNGFLLHHWFVQRPAAVAQMLETLGQLIRDGALVPQVHAKLPLHQAAQAHRLLETRQSRGKILLDPWA